MTESNVSDGEIAAGKAWFDENFNGCPDTETLVEGILTAAAKVRAIREGDGEVVARLHRKEGLGPVIERTDAAWEVGTGLFDLYAVKVADADGAPVANKGASALADVRRLIAEAGEKVEPIVGGPEGETIIAYKIPTGLWLMLQARVRNLIDHLPSPTATGGEKE